MKLSHIEDLKIITDSVVAPKGFYATGNHIGIKKKREDLALIKSEVPAVTAGVFTQNTVKAPPVLWNQKVINNRINGIVINSGIANACTGGQGAKNAELMAEAYAECLNVDKESIIVSSTGLIGSQLPMEIVIPGIKNVFTSLDNTEKSAHKAAKAIMTTDTFTKEIAVEVEVGGKIVKIGGIAKGSGMIHPNMATMLAFVTTDADISANLLQKALSESVNETYNMISVDGDTSTNDMVILLANGMAKNPSITEKNKDYEKFCQALGFVNKHLAKQIVKDGEGATKFLEVEAKGLYCKEDAEKIVKSVIASNLFKTAMFGEDANWGRILCAAGYSGVKFNPLLVNIEFLSSKGVIKTLINGEPVNFDETMAKKVLTEKEIKIELSFKEGNYNATAWGCDLSYEYVKINGEYRT